MSPTLQADSLLSEPPICHDSHANVFVARRRRKKKAKFLCYQYHAFFHFLLMKCMWRNKSYQSLVTNTEPHLGGSHRPGRMCQVSTWTCLRCAVLQYNNLDRAILFSRWESAANRTRTQLGLLGALFLENHSSIQSKQAETPRMAFCGLIFPCLWSHACLSRWWRRCGDGPVEVSCPCRSASLGCGLCGWAATGIFRRLVPAGGPGATPRGSMAPSTIIPVSSSLFSCFPGFLGRRC